ncbi:MAG TPA: sugar ABC transporter permease, partial [Candidatus Caenarcaniphilales bacterium]|nr:sugar ABC transporter permease [Candidatus Caenarcaniphilales bacterium]
AAGPSSIEQAGGGKPLPPLARAARAETPRGVRAGRLTPYLMMAPYLALFSLFVLLPAVYGLWVSLHDWDYQLPGKPFVGIDNYVNLFTPGSLTAGPFWDAMKATAIFTVFSVPFLLVVPLAVALILNQKFPGRNFFRAVYFAPYVLGVAAIGVLWTFLLDPNIGVVNYYLERIPGVPDNIAWTTSLPWAWIALVGVTVWRTLGYNAVIYLAGLQDIPRELYEAAKVDNAGRWSRFRHVTIPGLRPVLVFVVTVTVLASANMFGQAWLITEGAPGNETRTAIMLVAQEGLRNFRMGNAAAMSFVLAFFLLLVSIVNFAVFRERKPRR